MSTAFVSRGKQAALLLSFAVGCIVVGAASCANDQPANSIDTGHGNAGGHAPLDCSTPHPGCACAVEGQKVVCGEALSEVNGQTVCGRGITICEDGNYGECIINNTVTLAPGTVVQALGAPQSCQNPCDPYCNTFLDDPNGLGNPDAGTQATDGGITLLGNDAGVNTNCSGGTSGTCAHSICEPGAALAANCDGAFEAQPAPVPTTVFTEPFANNNAGWTLGTEWAIGSATASGGQQWGNPDPSTDTTPGANNGVAGVVIGGNATTFTHGFRYLTSPVINTAAYAGLGLTLSFNRFLNSDVLPWMDNVVQVFDGTNWVTIWENSPTDSTWQARSYDVTAYANANFRVRFGHMTAFASGHSSYIVSSWNIDDVQLVGMTVPAPTFGGSCVSQICAQMPACCSTGWTAACVALLAPTCNVTCSCTSDGHYLGCYHDAYDHDGDGYNGSAGAGDCMDCDPAINAGAYDFTNTLDDDCNGIVDDEPTNCDGALPLSTTNVWDHARAIDICRQTTRTAANAARSWGLITAESALVQADAASAPNQYAHGIMSSFGTNNIPFQGTRLAAYSSGTARVPGQANYVNPSGQVGSYNQNVSCAYPPGFPVNAPGCPNGVGNANDSAGLKLVIRAPTNALSFSYDFDFFSSEYPEWVCTPYNDHFVALLTSQNTNGNISFDANNKPVSVNIGFFSIPGCPTCTSPVLTNTGYDGTCSASGNYPGSAICGGATNWLFTSAPVTPGETIQLHFSVWDMSDHVWDSSVILDNFVWSPKAAIVQTGVVVTPPPTTYSDGYFVRDYDATGVCPAGYQVVWGHWSWTASTPGNSYVDFKVRTATTLAGLAAAPDDVLVFTNPPGPAALTGNPAVAQASPTDTQLGSAVVDTTLFNNNRATNNNFLRVTSHLAPTSDQLQAPTLQAWNMQFDCVPLQ